VPRVVVPRDRPRAPRPSQAKDGIVYDAKKLLADVGAMVEKQKQQRRRTTSQ